MIKSQTIGARLGLAMLGAGMLFGAAPALAQTGNPSFDNPSDALSRNLRSLAENPKSLHALMGAGKAALELGDPQAAITFFGRAEEQAPRDGRIKMWLGAALVQLQQPQGALKFFGDATALGAPEAEVAGMRGLAYDLLGDPRRAQRDYRLSLQNQANAEVSRRLALSLAISGEREAALQALEAQLLIRDRAAERAKVFVLALTGDPAGAARAVQVSMPAQGAALTPFLERLPALSPSERAMAVHLGHFPSRARNLPVPAPNVYASVDPSTAARAGAPDPRQAALGSRSTTSSRAQRQTAAPQAQPQRTQSVASQPQPRTQPPAAAQPQRVASVEQSPQAEPARRSERSSSSSVNSQWAWSRGISSERRTEPTATRPAPQPPQQQTAATQPRQAPVQQQVTASLTAPVEQPRQLASALAAATPNQPQPQFQPQPQPQPQNSAPVAFPAAQVQQQVAAAVPAPPPVQAPAQPPVQTAALAPSSVAAMPGFSISAPLAAAPVQSAPQPLPELASVEEAPPPAPGVDEGSGASRLAGIASVIASLPEAAPPEARAPATEPARPAPKPAAQPPVKETPATAVAKKEPPAAAKKEAPVLAKKEAPAAAAKKETPAAAAKKDPPAAAKKPAAPAEPSRIWVQVAGGADKAALPREFTRLKTKAPKLLAARAAWTTPLKATNRLLVGPFKSDKEAQDFVNELNKADLTGFAWTSDAGQKIEKLSAK